MNKKTIAFCLAFWLLLPNLILAATNKPSENTEFQVFKAQTELKFDAVKESQQKDLELTKLQITSQNEKIEQFNHQIDWLGHLIGYGSLGITLLLVLIGYFAYGKAKNDATTIAQTIAKDEANKTSQTEVQKWFSENVQNVKQEIEALKEKLLALEQDAKIHADGLHSKLNDTDKEIQAHARQIIIDNPLKSDTPQNLSSDDKQTLEKANTQLTQKPESEYTFDDWNTRAFAAYAENKLALAAEYWGYAAMVSDATNTNVAQALFSKGLALHEQDNFEAAMTCYDEVIKRFGTSSEAALQVTVAQSLVNKGATLGEQNKHDEAMTCYDEAIKRFGTSTETALQAAVAQTLANKGTTLNKQYKYEEAIAYYDEVVKRFSTITETNLQKSVSHALNGKGFSQLNLAKHAWKSVSERTNLLNSALNLFEQAQVKSSDIAIVLGNVAYTLWLLGRNDDAIPPLREALTLGGETLRDAELKDTETHPIESVDAGFRDLVNKIWEEVKPR